VTPEQRRQLMRHLIIPFDLHARLEASGAPVPAYLMASIAAGRQALGAASHDAAMAALDRVAVAAEATLAVLGGAR